MRVPIAISTLIFLAASALTCWLSAQGMDKKDFISLSIGGWATAGGLISASFVVYGYLINLKAFNQSQLPQILTFVENGQVKLIETGEVVHETRINYRNISSNECVGMTLQAHLVCGSESIEIPRLFNNPINLQVNDARVRNFPTFVYFGKNGIPQQVIESIAKYKLRISYKFISLGNAIERNYDYEWNQALHQWDIA